MPGLPACIKKPGHGPVTENPVNAGEITAVYDEMITCIMRAAGCMKCISEKRRPYFFENPSVSSMRGAVSRTIIA